MLLTLHVERIGWRNGIVISTAEDKVVLDAVSGAHLTKNSHLFVTHAHADHTSGLRSKARKYATRETLEIYENLTQKPVRNQVPLTMRRATSIGDITVTPVNAGHMLGSAQFLIHLPEKTVLYTGDINCVSTLTTEGAEKVGCDELIIEATYGNPFYIFPRRQLTYAKIVEWATRQGKRGLVPTFRVYAAGKAQEVIRIMNEYTKLQVLTCPSISRVNETHSKHGVHLEYSDLADDDVDRASVCVATYAHKVPMPERPVRAVATGWALGSRSSDSSSFPLSSHADFRQLVEYARSTGAKKIYVYTGYVDLFCDYLSRKLGVPTLPLPVLNQTELRDF